MPKDDMMNFLSSSEKTKTSNKKGISVKIQPISIDYFDDFYRNFPEEKTFLQSSKYGEFREKLGEKIFYLGIFEEKTLVGIVLVQKISTPFKTFLHVPHGILQQPKNKNSLEIWNEFLAFYIQLGILENCDFVRISPLVENFKPLPGLSALGFISSPVHLVNPEKTWVLDLSDSEENLLSRMKKSTRYEIRQSAKCGLTVKMGNDKEDLEIFWALHEETVKRQKFVPFSKKSTEWELEIFGENCQIISVFHEKTPLASGIFLFDDYAGYYHQGASVPSKLPVAYAYIWAAIQESKRRNCKIFNFWGVCDENNVRHPWFGLSKFKRGFGGREQNYWHAHDFPFHRGKYFLNFCLEKWRKWKKRY